MTNSMHGGRAGWIMREPWHVLVNDEVGGWAVANADVGHTSYLNLTNDQRIVAECYSEEHAIHIAEMHNEWLKGVEA